MLSPRVGLYQLSISRRAPPSLALLVLPVFEQRVRSVFGLIQALMFGWLASPVANVLVASMKDDSAPRTLAPMTGPTVELVPSVPKIMGPPESPCSQIAPSCRSAFSRLTVGPALKPVARAKRRNWPSGQLVRSALQVMPKPYTHSVDAALMPAGAVYATSRWVAMLVGTKLLRPMRTMSS